MMAVTVMSIRIASKIVSFISGSLLLLRASRATSAAAIVAASCGVESAHISLPSPFENPRVTADIFAALSKYLHPKFKYEKAFFV